MGAIRAPARSNRENVAFLGGPLHFLTELRAAFIRTLKLTDEHIYAPDNSHLFAAIGSAMNSKDSTVPLKELIEKINSEFEAFAKEAQQQAEKGNKAAGTRARKSALELSKLFKEFRKVSVEEAKK
jgi:activator of 2-hydroxyglutaryl-CoA dehydratase